MNQIDEKKLFNLVLSNKEYSDNKLDIVDIKDLNDKEKVILTMFVNKYIHLNPTVSKYNKYAYLLFDHINVLNMKTIFRGVFVSIDLFYQNKINRNYNNVLQIGVLPTFLEAYYYINDNKNTKYDFIKAKDNSLYDELIQSFTNINNNFKTINISNFYSSNNDKSIKNKYNLIIFDTYKNIYKINDQDYSDNINQRYLSSLLHTKYIFHQVIFALKKLENNGDLILLFSGYYNKVYQQIITILKSLFEEVICFNSEFDFSFRYFVIAKNYKPDNKIIDNLMTQYNQINLNSTNVLISLDIKYIESSARYDKILLDKFNQIKNKINLIKRFFNNEVLIKKIYYDIYFNQITRTNNWLKEINHKVKINENINNIIYDYKLFLFNKITSVKGNSYPINLINHSKLNILGEEINNDDFKMLIKPLEYISLFNVIGFNNDKYLSLKKELNLTLIDNHKNYIVYEDIKKSNILKKLDNNLIIKFTLDQITPLLLSFVYVLSKIYKKLIINNEYYIECYNKKDINIDNIIEFIDNSKLNDNYCLVSINEEFINVINNIISKLIVKELCDMIRYKYINDFPEYKLFYELLIKKTKKLSLINL